MPAPSSFRPSLATRRPSSRMAGAFEPGSDIREDDGLSSKRTNEQRDIDLKRDGEPDSTSLLPPQIDIPSSLLDESHMQEGTGARYEYDLPAVSNTVLEEEDMKRKLADFESSFIPEPSAMFPASDQTDGTSTSMPVDNFDPKLHDTHTTGGMHADDPFTARMPPTAMRSPTTAGYKTPEYEHEQDEGGRIPPSEQLGGGPNTSALERMSSSPTAAHTISRVQSLASMAGYETAAERDEPDSPTRTRARSHELDPEATPRKEHSTLTSNAPGNPKVNVDDYDVIPLNVTRRRPQYLSKRSSNARLSYDSVTSSTTETSEATLGADFALQTGGVAPDASKLRRKPNMTLSRSTSLGSLASGVSDMSDGEGAMPKRPGAGIAPDLTTLEEESPTFMRPARTSYSPPPAANVTPKPSTMRLSMPTDSVIANHVRDLQVPDTVARQFRSERSRSPDRAHLSLSLAAMTPGPKRGLTLKEHRSTVEKLGKENFDLKMKIHFLDQALQRRSEDGIKEMITENVQLKSDRLRLEKESHGLRKQIRDLLRKLEEATGKGETDDQGYATDEERTPTMEEELLYFRERIEVTEIELDRLRQDNIVKEGEKRRLAEMVRNLGDSRPGASEVGSREERDMWKDMLEAETIAREQAEDDARRLREELSKVKQDSARPASKLRVINGQVVSRSSSVDASKQKVDNVELERLRHECSELQKTIGAQASALTSRNKEKEMLYQEIENLKLGKMGGVRSIAGDSILDRSASRARSNSRASNGTRYTRLSDNERDNMESRIDQLRDELSQLKLDKQNLQNQFDEALAELDAVDAQAQADADIFNEEIGVLAQERDNAVREAEEQDQAFQQLKNEAQEEIDGLGDELDVKIEECNRLQQDLQSQGDNVKALQAEMRSAAEGLVRLEENAQQNLARYHAVKAELDDSNRELENLEKNLHESQSKVERLTVQRESSQNEIAFLREEQDADKIKIGDLEALLKKTHLNLDAERDRARELERRLSEERAQRDAIANQEKQEIQRTINELNREASTSKNELRQARKMLSQREIEVHNFKDRLSQLEQNLRQSLGLAEATSPHLVGAVTKMVHELDQANTDLSSVRQKFDDHKQLLSERDQLLEENAHEFRRLEDLLDKEIQYRRQDKHSFDQALRSQEQASRINSVHNARIAELEQAKLAHRKQLTNLETQYKDQLAERNQVLLSLWRKLSTLCGPDWAHNHSLINGNLPSQEVIGNIIFWPGFSRNLLLATKQVEGVLSGFRDRIKVIERDLHRNYTSLEKEFDARSKKLERIEQHWESIKLREREIDAGLASSHNIRLAKPEMQKLKNENKLLKAELRLYQDAPHNTHPSHARSHQRAGAESRSSEFSGLSGDVAGIPNRDSSVRTSRKNGGSSVTLSRNNSTNAVETLSNRPGSSTSKNGSNMYGFTVGNPGTVLAAQSTQMSTTDSSLSKDDARRSLVVPPGPSTYPPTGNHGVPPDSSHSHNSEAGTITKSTSHSKNDEKKWIHRLRELERRLKNEREQRLVDRDGARRRLEERDETNDKLKRELDRERLGRGWKQDHDGKGGGYLVADEPMLNEVIGQINAQTREEFIPSTPYEDEEYYNNQQAQEQDELDEGLRTSEEERLMAMAHAQFPTVGSSHAQRLAAKEQRGTRPESIRTASRGSIMNVSPSRKGTSSIKDRITGARNTSYNGNYFLYSTHGQQQSTATVNSGMRSTTGDHVESSADDRNSASYPPGERWGRSGCEKDGTPFSPGSLSRQQSDNGQGGGEGNDGIRRVMRTASAMAGMS